MPHFFLLLAFISSCPVPVQQESSSTYDAFGEPQLVTIRQYRGVVMEVFLSRDGDYLLFNNSNESRSNTDLHFATRVDDLTFKYGGKVEGANTLKLDGVPSMDQNNLLYFVSVRGYGQPSFATIFCGKWKEGKVTRTKLVDGISPDRAGIIDFDVEVSHDGETMVFAEGQFSGKQTPDTANLVIATRIDDGEFRRLESSQDIFSNINTDALEYAACLSKDGLELFFTRADLRTGSISAPSIWRATRRDTGEPFRVPQRVKSITGFAEAPTFSPDEKALYFHKRQESGKYKVYRVER